MHRHEKRYTFRNTEIYIYYHISHYLWIMFISVGDKYIRGHHEERGALVKMIPEVKKRLRW